MKAVTHTLSDGTQITDARDFGMGIHITRQDENKMLKLQYNSKDGFYISVSGCWLYPNGIERFKKELEAVESLLIEAKELLDVR